MTSLLLAPLSEGLIQNQDPWLCPPNSFSVMEDCRISLGAIMSRKGKALWGTIPTKNPILGIRLLDGVGSIPLVWDKANLFRGSSGSNKLEALNTTPLKGGEVPVISVVWKTPGIATIVYFTYPGQPQGFYKYSGSAVRPVAFKTSLNTTIVGAQTLAILGGRLLIFGPYEKTSSGTTFHGNRVWWSAIASPEDFLSPEAGYADAATASGIVGTAPLLSHGVVAFTEGLWLLENRLDPLNPFTWSPLESRCRAFGAHSLLSYGTTVKVFGERGLWVTDGRSVERIDQKIPFFLSREVKNADGNTVFCWEDALGQRSWCLYSGIGDRSYALIYDHLAEAFSTSTEGYTVLGVIKGALSSRWSDFSAENGKHWKIKELVGLKLKDWVFGAESPRRVGGDREGNIWDIDVGSFSPEEPFTSHLLTAAWNPFIQEGKACKLLYVDLYLDCVANQRLTCSFYKDNQRMPYREASISLLPTKGFVGSVTGVQRGAKTFLSLPNHGLLSGERIYIVEVQGPTTLNRQAGFVVDVVDNETVELVETNSTLWPAYQGGGQAFLNPIESEKVWKRIYAQGTGFQHQVEIQVKGTFATYFKLHAIKPTFKPFGKRLI